MPKVSEFFGIVIALFYADHAPPHFHARYGEHEALVDIGTLTVLRGALPRRALALVLEWAALHQWGLRADWDLARRGLPLAPILPLDYDPPVIRIRTVRPLEGYTVELLLTDGTRKAVDLGPYLRGPVFEPLLRDPSLFRAVAVDASLGTIVWPNGADLDPDVLVCGLSPA